MELRNKKMVFLGDSITEGVGVKDAKNIYWKRLEQDGCQVFGYGIGGTRIAPQTTPSNEIWDKYFASRIPEMEENADVVVVFGGTNDYGHGDAAMGTMSDRTDNTFYGALHQLVQKLKEKYPAAAIVLMTPIHRMNEERLYNERGIRNVGTLKDYVEAIREVGAYHGVSVLDTYEKSGIYTDDAAFREQYIPDGLHPNDAGHEFLYTCLKAHLESL